MTPASNIPLTFAERINPSPIIDVLHGVGTCVHPPSMDWYGSDVPGLMLKNNKKLLTNDNKGAMIPNVKG